MIVPESAGPPTRPARRPNTVRITERDRRLLSFMADHRLVLADHVQALLGLSSSSAATARLRALRSAGYVDCERKLHAEPAAWQITRSGLRAIGSGLSRPRPTDLSCYRHDVGVAWVWLAARSGRFGELRGIVSERRMRSHDGVNREGEAFGVRLGGPGPDGGPRRHYPDLILESASGHRVAVELELSSKSRARREGILAGYGAEGRIDAMLYLVDRRSVARAIEWSAARYGMADRVHVQMVRLAPLGRGDRNAAVRSPSRSTGHEVSR